MRTASATSASLIEHRNLSCLPAIGWKSTRSFRRFRIIGTLLGVLTASVAFNAMALLGLNTYYQYLFQGALLIVAVGVGVGAGPARRGPIAGCND
jgi:ABC-type xylose transport system permease subunit